MPLSYKPLFVLANNWDSRFSQESFEANSSLAKLYAMDRNRWYSLGARSGYRVDA